MSVRVGRVGAWGAVVVAAPLLAVALAGPAHAHNVLESTVPADGATVDTTPAEVVLRFDQPVLGLGAAVRVTGPDGDMQTGAPESIDSAVRQALRPGSPAGRYTVAWRVTSSDGHPITGEFGFTSAAAGTASATASSATATPTAGGPTDAPSAEDASDERDDWRDQWPGILAGAAIGTLGGIAIVMRNRRRERANR